MKKNLTKLLVLTAITTSLNAEVQTVKNEFTLSKNEIKNCPKKNSFTTKNNDSFTIEEQLYFQLIDDIFVKTDVNYYNYFNTQEKWNIFSIELVNQVNSFFVEGTCERCLALHLDERT